MSALAILCWDTDFEHDALAIWTDAYGCFCCGAVETIKENEMARRELEGVRITLKELFWACAVQL